MAISRFAALSLCLTVCGCEAPKDPEGSTDRIARTHVMRVGVSENPPFVRLQAGQPMGVEPALVRRYAATLGAKVEWVSNGETPMLQALEHHELDLVIGGLQANTPWKKKLGLSRPYLKTEWIVGIRRGSPAPSTLHGLRIAAPPGSPIAARLRAMGATPVAPGVGAAWQAAALHDFEAGQTDLVPIGLKLGREKHVIAVAPGENRLLLSLDRFLATAALPLEDSTVDAQG